ncbi:hypothetical protein B0H11DRAFT_523686 [Mycena galericulata]|nr:hypothetical protein B0H11DRAFT_523686 [Mycena galericulata]
MRGAEGERESAGMASHPISSHRHLPHPAPRFLPSVLRSSARSRAATSIRLPASCPLRGGTPLTLLLTNDECAAAAGAHTEPRLASAIPRAAAWNWRGQATSRLRSSAFPLHARPAAPDASLRLHFLRRWMLDAASPVPVSRQSAVFQIARLPPPPSSLLPLALKRFAYPLLALPPPPTILPPRLLWMADAGSRLSSLGVVAVGYEGEVE